MNQVGELDLDAVIWRYLTFKKFAALIDLRAAWFAKLGIFEDIEEGMTPALTRQAIKSQHREIETWFPDEERKSQVRRFVEDNERYGRDLIVASRWFIGNHESEEMWAKYAKDSESVAVKSTARALMYSLDQSLKSKWWIGKVRYVDHSTYEGMNIHEGHQAHLRAFVKGMKYARENELRVATMNFVAPGCLIPDGTPQSEKQRRGFIDVSNGPGIYVRANFATLISELRTAPGASDNDRAKVEILASKGGLQIPVRHSELSAR
ncbi:MAG: hypothetical protein WDN02_03030 [Methylovirgula sp.]|uniref:hypothetical protein n=1 Tax=Methylovirgula sp. TaxID=1978224 RepID=UPI0030760F67